MIPPGIYQMSTVQWAETSFSPDMMDRNYWHLLYRGETEAQRRQHLLLKAVRLIAVKSSRTAT